MTDGMRWCDFGATAPHLESYGRRRLERRIAYLATIRRDGAPRLHPVSPFIGAGGLFVYMEPTSPKVRDLRRDPRFALHCGVEDNEGGAGEFYAAGQTEEVGGHDRRSEAFDIARAAGYKPENFHVLFELKIEQVLITRYENGRRRIRWSASAGDP